MTSLNLRPAVPEDLDDIFILYKLAMEEVSSLGGWPLQDNFEAWRTSYDALKLTLDDMTENKENAGSRIWVVEDKVVVGFGFATVQTLDPPYQPMVLAKSIYTYILPQYRGGDTAKQIMCAKMAWAKSKGANDIYAYVTDPNRSRILMERGGYRKFGFELVKSLP